MLKKNLSTPFQRLSVLIVDSDLAMGDTSFRDKKSK